MADQTDPASTESETQDAPAEDAPAKDVQEAPAKEAAPVKRRTVPVPVAPPPSKVAPLLIAAAIGLVAGLIGGGAVAALWHPSSGSSAKFNNQQIKDASKDVCNAVVLARQAVANNMHLKNPEPENPIAQLAVAANARLSLTAGAAYLRGRLEAEAATPAEIVAETNEMAAALERLNLSYLVGQPNSEREQLGHDLDSHITALGKLCQDNA